MLSVTKYIKQATGKTLKEYCENVLNVDSKAFYWRVRSGKVYINEANQIMNDTGQPFEVLFPPRAPEKRKARPTKPKDKEKQEPPDKEYLYIE